DVVYVEELIGSDTINTLPPQTLAAFRDHGRPRASLTEDVETACDTLNMLGDAGISMSAISDTLLTQGVRLFSDAFVKLLATIETHSRTPVTRRFDRFGYVLDRPMIDAVQTSLAEWRADGRARRLWARDASLWTGKDEGQWLGWLGITNGQLAHVQRLTKVTQAALSAGFSHVLLLGMGGSSLGPEVM